MSRQRALDNLCGKIHHNSHLTSIEIRGRASRTRKFEMCDLFLNDTLLLFFFKDTFYWYAMRYSFRVMISVF